MARHYDDDYESSSFEKFTHRKSKSHKKGHQSRGMNSEKVRWQKIMEEDNEELVETVMSVPTTPTVTEPTRNPHQFGNNTHEIKGVKIDFDGVADIQKIENIKDNATTYGIKFLFKGKKGLYRIIWFNTNMRARDAAYNTEYGFWLTINK